MPVRYTPALREQLRPVRPVETPVIVKVRDRFVERVNPHTRKCTGEAQQFRKGENGALAILPRSQWVTEPNVIEVAAMDYR